MYYRDLGVKYYVPYDYIDRTFTRISECQPDDTAPLITTTVSFLYTTARSLQTSSSTKKRTLTASTRSGKRSIPPNIAYGYIPPADGKRSRLS